jgi:hypothetical protein
MGFPCRNSECDVVCSARQLKYAHDVRQIYGLWEINGGAFAHLRAIGFLIQATVLAKPQRRKGRQGETPATMAPFNSQKP